MAEDGQGLPRERDSASTSFDFDDQSIADLLDTFIAKQTGPPRRRTSHPASAADTGAQAAQRTVFQHASRKQTLPLVGDERASKARRITLLRSLAERKSGSIRARLLTSAGELYEQLGEPDQALLVYRRALDADARDVVALRALRRLAIHRRDWPTAAQALGQEAALELSAAERAAALKLLTHIHLRQIGDSAAAEGAAERACRLKEDDFVAWLMLGSARLVRGDLGGAGAAIAKAADHWPDAAAQAVLIQHAGGLTEQAGDIEAASALYRRASQLDPSSLSSRFGSIRACRELGDARATIESLRGALDQVRSTELQSGLRRAIARAVDDTHERPNGALAEIEQERDIASRWTRAEIAVHQDDFATAIASFGIEQDVDSDEACAIQRARTGKLEAELGSEPTIASDDADEALRDYVRAARRLAEGDAADAGELELVLDAMLTSPSSVAADMVRTDRAAWTGDGAAWFAGLERELDRGADRVGGALALAEVAEEAGVGSRREALLRAHEHGERETIIARALALSSTDPHSAAEAWREEGSLASASHAAFGSTMAARWLAKAGVDATEALETALRCQQDYWPALWELEDGPHPQESRLRSAAAQAALPSPESSEASVRAAAWATSEPEQLRYAEAALDRNAPDPLLLEWCVAAAGTYTEAAAELLALGAEHFDPLPYLLRAAAAFRGAGRPARAAKTYREASSHDASEILGAACEEAELEAAEFARVDDRAMRRAREAEHQDDELRALAWMAAVDRLARRDMRTARLSLQSIAKSCPDHLPTARILEWDALRENDQERIVSSARRLLDCLAPGSPERVARHRLMIEAWRADPDILAPKVDQLLRGVGAELVADPGLARLVLGMAYASGDSQTALFALQAIEDHQTTDVERSAIALERAHMLEGLGRLDEALAVLAEARAHPLALEREAQLLEATGRWAEATAKYREAALRAKDGQRAASLWRHAASIFEAELDDADRAVEAYVAATEADITYLDVYRRLVALYRNEGRFEDAEALTESRIDAGGDTPTLVALLLEQAAQRKDRGDSEGVIESLHRCLEVDPGHFVALSELVDTHRRRQDWHGAAEALIRIARLDRSTVERVWAFSQLAEIYDEHLQDPTRAEAALRQVLKLAPAHTETLDRLAHVLSTLGRNDEAARVLQRLVSSADDPSEQRDYRIRLAAAIETAGHPRQAESYLERLRTEQPTEVDVILALADHYDRQNAAPAAAMHLNRALVDLRDAIDARPADESLWTTLVRVLARRRGAGPASCAASAAVAIGYPPTLFSGAITDEGVALGDPDFPLSREVDRLVTPKVLPPTALRLFALCEQAFDKVLPFDAAAWKLKRLSSRERALIEEAGLVAEGLGMSEPKLRLTHGSPLACMPISGDPPTLVLGVGLAELTSHQERVFLFARALKVAGSHLAPALRARAEDLDAVLLTLLGTHEASRATRLAPPHAQELRRKLVRAIPRRARDEVESLVLELRGDQAFSARSVPSAIGELGSRVALTLTGDVPSAVSALVKIAALEVPRSSTERLARIRGVPDAWNLVRFATSNAHFEARTQAGVDP